MSVSTLSVFIPSLIVVLLSMESWAVTAVAPQKFRGIGVPGSLDDGWKGMASNASATCRSNAARSAENKINVYHSCFNQNDIIAAATEICRTNRYEAQSLACNGQYNEMQCFEEARNAANSQCASDVRSYVSRIVATATDGLRGPTGTGECTQLELQTGTCADEATDADVAATPIDGSAARRAEDNRAAAAAAAEGGGEGSGGSGDGGSGGEREGSAGGDPASTGQGSYASPERTAACTAAKSDAIQCCNNPLGCMIGGANSGVGTAVQSGVGMVGQIGGMVAGSGQMGSKQMCDFMKIAGSATAGINMAGAAVCQQKKSVCNRACDGVEAGACDMLNINIAAQANQAIQSAYAAKMGQECAQLTDANNGLKPADFDPKSDCSDPANSTNPYCQDCSGPNAKNNPFCRTPSKGTGSSSGFASGNGGADFGSNGDGGYDSNPDLGDAISQQQDLGMGADTRSEANPIGGGGGGMAGGGAGGASLGDGNPGAGTGGGYNTAVLKGVGGGGGYTAPTTSRVAVSSGGGGFSGYGSGGAKDPGLDLRQFLPGAQNDPRKGRSVAGLAQAADAQIGRKETNIFQTMSVKYKQMCQLQRMWDCPKLSQKTGGF